MDKESFESILLSLESYCAYWERSPKEVTAKANSLGLLPDDREAALEHLIQENFLSEKRYAESYCYGKFTHNKWGKSKIRFQLKGQNIPNEVIEEALDTIDEKNYEHTLSILLKKKAKEIKAPSNPSLERKKLFQFALSRGFEAETFNRVYTKNQGMPKKPPFSIR